MRRVAPVVAGTRTQANGSVFGLDPAQESCGRACTVWHLSVHVVCLGQRAQFSSGAGSHWDPGPGVIPIYLGS
jgi:hypothetical protein